MTKAALITNPHASRARRGLKLAVARLRDGGLDVEVIPTAHAGHGADLARRAIDAGAELVIAHGGDGTLMDIAPAVVESGCPLGILPAGTGNRLADNLGIPWDPDTAAGVILDGVLRPIDLGRMTSDAGDRYFAVAAGCGFDAEIMHRTKRQTKAKFGVAAYFATGVGLAMDLPKGQLTVHVDDQVVEKNGVSVIIANCGEIIPSGYKFAEQISLTDGMLDVFVINAETFRGALRVTWLLATGQALEDPRVSLVRGTRITVQSDPPMAAQADGDPWGHTPLSAEVIAGAMKVLTPRWT